MRIVPQSARLSYSPLPDVPLLAASSIAGLLPAVLPRSAPKTETAYADPVIEVGVNRIREMLIACQQGSRGLSDLLTAVTDVYYAMRKDEEPLTLDQVSVPFRTIEDMNHELLDRFGDTLRCLGRHQQRGGVL
jgi:hypothetical protein